MNFDHLGLHVRKMSCMINFYTNILGLQVERLQEYQSGEASFPVIRLSSNCIIDLMPIDKISKDKNNLVGHIKNMHHFCIAVSFDEWEIINKNIAKHKVILEKGPVLFTGAQGKGTSFFIRDPENNLVELKYYS